MSELQKHGFVFGDLKPANIGVFLRKNPEKLRYLTLKLLDVAGCRVYKADNNPNNPSPTRFFCTKDYLPSCYLAKNKKISEISFSLDAYAIGKTLCCLWLGPQAYALSDDQISGFLKNHPDHFFGRFAGVLDQEQGLLGRGLAKKGTSGVLERPLPEAFERFKEACRPSASSSASTSTPSMASAMVTNRVPRILSSSELADQVGFISPLLTERFVQAVKSLLPPIPDVLTRLQNSNAMQSYLEVLEYLFTSEKQKLTGQGV